MHTQERVAAVLATSALILPITVLPAKAMQVHVERGQCRVQFTQEEKKELEVDHDELVYRLPQAKEYVEGVEAKALPEPAEEKLAQELQSCADELDESSESPALIVIFLGVLALAVVLAVAGLLYRQRHPL